MKKRIHTGLALALAAAVLAAPAHAADHAAVLDRLERMERRVMELERKVMEQERVIAEKKHEIARRDEADGGWWKSVSVSGLLEMEASRHDSDAPGRNTETDLAQATVELGVAAEVSDWTSAEVVLLYEDEGQDDSNLAVDSATISFGPPNGPWHVTAGRQYLPFGTYETHLVSDTLTLELAETVETAAAFGARLGRGLHGGIYAFNGGGSVDGDGKIEDFGAHLGYAAEAGSNAFSVDLAYINNIKETDMLEGFESTDLEKAMMGSDTLVDNGDREGGYALSVAMTRGPFSLIGEYISAASELYTCGTAISDGTMGPPATVGSATACREPQAWTLEFGWTVRMGPRDVTFAIGQHETEDMMEFDLPEQKWLMGFTTELVPGVGLGVEWATDEDYGSIDSDTLTVRLDTEF